MHQWMPYVSHSSLFQMGIFIRVTPSLFPHCILTMGEDVGGKQLLFNSEVARLKGTTSNTNGEDCPSPGDTTPIAQCPDGILDGLPWWMGSMYKRKKYVDI